MRQPFVNEGECPMLKKIVFMAAICAIAAIPAGAGALPLAQKAGIANSDTVQLVREGCGRAAAAACSGASAGGAASRTTRALRSETWCAEAKCAVAIGGLADAACAGAIAAGTAFATDRRGIN
jgi:hypothetical protein